MRTFVVMTSPRKRIPLPNLLLIVVAFGVVLGLPAYLMFSPDQTSSSETKKPSAVVKTSKPNLPTINGYTYPDARCVNDWPPDKTWVGVGKLKNGKLGVVTQEDIQVWASSPEDDYDWMPDVDIYCPPGTTVS